jgi:hypothetical protein
MRLFELDIGDNTAENVVFNSSLGRYGFIFRIKHCLMIDINPYPANVENTVSC